ncbi:MAG TPA: hypothetical protein VM901_00600 [Bdellovibrionota bacterium]|jgi:Holliday junction resolvasome RuvABC DNA-binding subunit|nr:hypothetical protein [Bdellovibrionota bacterium]
MSTLGPKFFMRCKAPVEWNRSLAHDVTLSSEVYVEDIQGNGWKVEIYSDALKKNLLGSASPLDVFVAHIIREDAEMYYLFETQAQREIFETLNAIKGINVNVAATAVATVGPALLLQWLQGASIKGYKFTGLGPKTIEKLVYEMQAKKAKFVPLLQSAVTDVSAAPGKVSGVGAAHVVVAPTILLGLEKLGLRPADTLRIIEDLRAQDPSTSDLSDQALIAKILQYWGKEKWSSGKTP